jgi:signal transduction histidine kinase
MLLVAFFGTIVCFVLAAWASSYRERGILRAAENIADDALPAIQHLANARRSLREVASTLDDLTGGLPSDSESPPEELHAELKRSRELLDRDWQDYKVLPPYPGEAELQASTEQTLRSAERSFDLVLSRLQSGDERGARKARNMRAERDAARLDSELESLLDLNAIRATEQSRLITGIRKESRVFSFTLQAMSALFAAVAALLVVRVVRRFAQVTDLRLSELELFAGRVAHDIRSPLCSVGMALELAVKDEQLGEKARARLARSAGVVQRIGQLVDGLLVFAAAGGRPPEDARADVPRVLNGVIEGTQPRAEENDIDLHLESVDAGTVACSPGVLTSLLVNLIGNAIKYMGDTAVRRINVRALRVDGVMRIEVEDTGPGVAPELRQRIFDPHVRGPNRFPRNDRGGAGEVPGLGLGLATVRRLVDAHGGSVGVEGTASGGSLFWFQLPRVDVVHGVHNLP